MEDKFYVWPEPKTTYAVLRNYSVVELEFIGIYNVVRTINGIYIPHSNIILIAKVKN